MRSPAPIASVLCVEVARCRMRPVLGRAPLLGGLVVAATCALVHLGGLGVEASHQVADTISIAATVAALLAVGVGAAVVHDARTSGTDATDRSMVGRRLWLPACRIAGVGAWVAVVTMVLASVGAVGLTLGAALGGQVARPERWLVPATGAGLQAAVAVGLAAATGAAATTIVRSPASVMAGLFGMLLVGDPLLVDRVPASAPLLLPDNLLGFASGELEGLAVRASSWPAVAGAALIGVVALAAMATLVDARRDAGG